MTVLTKTYPLPPIDTRAVWRYAAAKSPTDEMTTLLQACLAESENKFTYAVCYAELPLTTDGALCDFGAFSVRSASLAEHLNGCERAVVFAATVGVELDRLIARYAALSPAKALLFQAIGTERIETLCDAFCLDVAGNNARFSPGYGDVPLTVQRDIIALLNTQKHIGVTLCDSLLMSPTKSVTAFVGLPRKEVMV